MILQSRYLFKVLAILSLFLTIIYTKYYPFKSKYNINETNFTGIVEDYTITDSKIRITIKGKERLIIEYKYNNLVFNNLSYGDKIKVTGTLTIPSSNKIFNNFNYKDYLYNKKIYYIVKADKIDKIKNNSNIFYTIKNILYDRINNLKSSKYIKALLFGDNKLDSDIKKSYQINGISHLFSVSGFHINFFSSIIYLYLDRVTYNKKFKYIIIDIFLILYLFLCNSSSLLRCVIFNILLSINFIFKLNIKKIDLLLFTLVTSSAIKPFIIYDIGFIYSYVISFFLILFKDKHKTNNRIIKVIYISLISFISSIPITIYNNYEINFLSIVVNILIMPIISIVFLISSIVVFIFPIFDSIFYKIINIFESISLSLSRIDLFKLILSKPSIILIIIYYGVIILVLNRKKYIYILILLLLFHKILPLFNSNFEVVMFDVGQADSIFISTNRNVNILIDTGTGYEVDNIITYFKSIGISSLDYLIITHGDEDHIGGAISLVEDFKVDYVVFNNGDYSSLEIELIDKLKDMNILYGNSLDKISIGNSYIYFINDKVYSNENDNSIVSYFKYLEYSFLFMGDASSVVENYLISNYNLKDISFLKVGHHGSKSSTSSSFVSKITPSVGLISVGENNFYNHPNSEVIDNLSNSIIFRTDIMGSIKIMINKKGKVSVSHSK